MDPPVTRGECTARARCRIAENKIQNLEAGFLRDAAAIVKVCATSARGPRRLLRKLRLRKFRFTENGIARLIKIQTLIDHRQNHNSLIILMNRPWLLLLRTERKSGTHQDELAAWLEEVLQDHGVECEGFGQDMLQTDTVDNQEESVNPDFEDAEELDVPTLVQHTQTFTQFFVSLKTGDRDMSSSRFLLRSPIQSGPPGTRVNLKATCKKHSNKDHSCICWLTPKMVVSTETVLRDLAAWTASADSVDFAAHARESVGLREEYGHKPRS